MSSSLMDTEPGGEQTPYEGEASDMQPHAKLAGQLGDPSTHTRAPTHAPAARDPSAPNTHGISTADKIRYGQAIQEGGMGGKTDSVTGEAKSAGGFGGAKAKEEGGGQDDGEAARTRREQGYGGEADMDRDIGA
ncbi:hypothetical protein BDV95DRAFT_360580 [Massariosphaeria phaeospora]|uniref:Uncharacterized protein n=1 Tax=Massariosphaeria phaeospora TaxID=100035 RepID=A0A7C8MBR6_9PLEO|nr:hypothetical protein BDV95DRAFT_360580 [Massariosphaeria phaeospora]